VLQPRPRSTAGRGSGPRSSSATRFGQMFRLLCLIFNSPLALPQSAASPATNGGDAKWSHQFTFPPGRRRRLYARPCCIQNPKEIKPQHAHAVGSSVCLFSTEAMLRTIGANETTATLGIGVANG
jgi:hypothetical protein